MSSEEKHKTRMIRKIRKDLSASQDTIVYRKILQVLSEKIVCKNLSNTMYIWNNDVMAVPVHMIRNKQWYFSSAMYCKVLMLGWKN